MESHLQSTSVSRIQRQQYMHKLINYIKTKIGNVVTSNRDKQYEREREGARKIKPNIKQAKISIALQIFCFFLYFLFWTGLDYRNRHWLIHSHNRVTINFKYLLKDNESFTFIPLLSSFLFFCLLFVPLLLLLLLRRPPARVYKKPKRRRKRKNRPIRIYVIYISSHSFKASVLSFKNILIEYHSMKWVWSGAHTNT